MFVFPLFVFAQPMIRGRVVDAANGEPLFYATVACYEGKSALRAVTTDRSGHFGVRGGEKQECRIVTSCVGYLTDTLHVRLTDEPEFEVGDVKLRAGVEINAVEIQGQKPLFEQHDDRYVYNVSADPEAKRLKMLEMMLKVPLLEIRENGKITYLGKDDVQIRVDGEQHELISVGKQYVMNFLRADLMNQIEIIPPGSPEYNNDKPILNIRTARRIPNGFALQLIGSGDTNNSWSGGVDFVSKIRDRVIFGMGYKLTYADAPDLHSTLRREITNGDQLSETQQTHATNGSDQLRHNFNLRASTKVLGNPFRLGLSTSLGENHRVVHNNLIRSDAAGTEFLQQNTRTNGTTRTRPRLNADAAYLHKLGSGYWAEYGYTLTDSRSENDSRSKTLFSDNRPFQERISESTTGTREHRAAIAVRNRFEGGKIKPHRFLGTLSYVDRKYTNVAERMRWDALAMDYQPDNSYNAGLNYVQRVAALSAVYSYFSRGLQFSFGANANYEQSRGAFEGGSTASVLYEKVNLLPRTSINYRFNKKWNMSMGYDMSVLRPDFTMLNSYVDETDSMNLRMGNPRLNPERSHNVRLGLNRVFVQGRRAIFFDLLYSHIGRAIEQITAVDAHSGISTTTYDNVGVRNNFTAKLTLWGLVSTKWCNWGGEVAYNYVDYNSRNTQSRMVGSQHAVAAQTTLRLSLWRGAWLGGSYQLSSDVGSPQNGGVRYTHSCSFRLDQTLVRNRFYLSAWIDNPFESHRYIASSLWGENYRSYSRQERRGRIFGISLIANFGRFRDRINEGSAAADDRSRALLPDHSMH